MKKQKLLLNTLLIYSLFFGIFLAIHLAVNNFISTDDTYYHAKHSQLIWESGKITLVQPWVRFHFLSTAPADPYFLYHLVAAGFIGLWGVTLGTKLLSATLGALLFPIFYLILKHHRVSRPWVWLILLFASSTTFLFRLTLERPFVLSVALLPLAYYLIVKNKHLFLFFLAAIYILLYNLAPLIIFLALLFVLADLYHRRPINLKPLIATAGGILTGLILHPQTLNYLHVIYIHFVKILFLKLRGVPLPSGAEIQLISSSSFIKSNFIILFFFVFAIGVAGASQYYKKNKESYFFVVSLMGVFWFLVSFFVARGTEYWLPFGWLFVALAREEAVKSGDYAIIKQFLKSKTRLSLLLFFFISPFIILMGYSIFAVSATLLARDRSDNTAQYQTANQFLKENTAEDSLVFYSNWSMFPRMFFFNTHNIYPAAFDPVFLYDYNPEIYWIWYNISIKGEFCRAAPPCVLDWSPKKNVRRIQSAMRNIFDTDTLIIQKNYRPELRSLLLANPKEFTKIYENDELEVFRVGEASKLPGTEPIIGN